MGLSKKGMRKIVFEGKTYLWKINHKRPYFSEHGYLPMYTAIQLDSNESTKLIVNLKMAPPLNYAFGDDPRVTFRPITPKDISGFIKKAIKSGWNANTNGKPFQLEVDLEIE